MVAYMKIICGTYMLVLAVDVSHSPAKPMISSPVESWLKNRGWPREGSNRQASRQTQLSSKQNPVLLGHIDGASIPMAHLMELLKNIQKRRSGWLALYQLLALLVPPKHICFYSIMLLNKKVQCHETNNLSDILFPMNAPAVFIF